MSKVAYIFPGQGAQRIGMGKDFFDRFDKSRKVFHTASALLDLDMEKICFEENSRLDITEFTQAALLTTEVAMLEAVREQGLPSEANAGLSLGEYSALVASGVLSFESAIRIVRQRGILMQQAVPAGEGTMVAVMGLPVLDIEKICGESQGIVEIANYNSPGQTVISGEKDAVLAAKKKLEEAGAKMAVELNVSGPFHSSMLQGAGEKLGQVLKEEALEEIGVPYLSNVTGDYVTDASQVKGLLVKQVHSPVKWYQIIERLAADGFDTFIEIGPGKTLAGFNKRINKGIKTINIAAVEDLNQLG